MARPTKYTPRTVRTLLKMLRQGTPRIHAAQAAGIHYDTFREWEKARPEFSEAIRKAESQAIADRVARIQGAAKGGNWQADAWWLERRHPNDFGRRDRIDVYEHERVRQEAERIAARFGVPVSMVLERAGIVLPSSN
jgi:hypothetical protein